MPSSRTFLTGPKTPPVRANTLELLASISSTSPPSPPDDSGGGSVSSSRDATASASAAAVTAATKHATSEVPREDGRATGERTPDSVHEDTAPAPAPAPAHVADAVDTLTCLKKSEGLHAPRGNSTLTEEKRIIIAEEKRIIDAARLRPYTTLVKDDVRAPTVRGGGKARALPAARSTNNGSTYSAIVAADKKPKAYEPPVSWDVRYAQLCEYHKAHGNSVVPLNQGKLGSWVRNQRKQHGYKREGKKSYLNDEREKKLDDLDFVWKMQKQGPAVAWEERYKELCVYKRQHGHCLFPTHEGKLGRWVHNQRTQYRLKKEGKKSCLSDERQVKLEILDFVWKMKQEAKIQGPVVPRGSRDMKS